MWHDSQKIGWFVKMAVHVYLLSCIFALVNSQLVVNVKNKGQDVVVETIKANVSDDTVTLHFQSTDGTLVHQLIDYKYVSIKQM